MTLTLGNKRKFIKDKKDNFKETESDEEDEIEAQVMIKNKRNLKKKES